jgi:ABC-type dipeptide/oligopeptide/nickel transport system permease component
MGRYLVVRLYSMLLTLLGLTVLVFLMPRWAWAAPHRLVPLQANETIP